MLSNSIRQSFIALPFCNMTSKNHTILCVYITIIVYICGGHINVFISYPLCKIACERHTVFCIYLTIGIYIPNRNISINCNRQLICKTAIIFGFLKVDYNVCCAFTFWFYNNFSAIIDISLIISAMSEFSTSTSGTTSQKYSQKE